MYVCNNVCMCIIPIIYKYISVKGGNESVPIYNIYNVDKNMKTEEQNQRRLYWRFGWKPPFFNENHKVCTSHSSYNNVSNQWCLLSLFFSLALCLRFSIRIFLRNSFSAFARCRNLGPIYIYIICIIFHANKRHVGPTWIYNQSLPTRYNRRRYTSMPTINV